MRVEEGACLCLFQRGCVYYLIMFSDYLMMYTQTDKYAAIQIHT